MKKLISIVLSVIITLSCLNSIIVNASVEQDVVNEARKWIGTKYGHSDGSGGPNTVVDCCGLVLQVYKKHGYTLPWTVEGYGNVTGQKDLGKKVTNNIPSKNYSNLQPGDLIVFYGHSGTTWHIGIYSGNGYVINAQSSGVKEAYLSDYWYRYAVGVRRIIGNVSAFDNSSKKEALNITSTSSKPSGISDTSKTLRWKELNKKYDITTEELQRCLNYIMGVSLKVDGIYGIDTHDVVKEFQGEYGLTIDGDAGPKTLNKVNEVLNVNGGAHKHSYSGTWHEAVHPHREYKKCACGYTELTGKNVTLNECSQCITPGKPALINMKTEYAEGTEIVFSWNPTVNTTHYNLYISKTDLNGEYKYYENIFYAESGMKRKLERGKYSVILQPTNSKAWTDDKSTWRFTNSDTYYFEVISEHTHDFAIKYDAKHPHGEYKICDCGEVRYTGEFQTVMSCEKCFPHEHDYGISYTSSHPHEKFLECDCGHIEYTGETKKVSTCEECFPITINNKTVKLQIGIPNMFIDGKTQEIDPGRETSPVIKNDRTLLPIRAVVETFGAYVVWDENESKITIYTNETTMNFWINSKKAVVNERTYTMDVEPVIINDRTFMPLRFIAEKMGLQVGWNSQNQTVTIEGTVK